MNPSRSTIRILRRVSAAVVGDLFCLLATVVPTITDPYDVTREILERRPVGHLLSLVLHLLHPRSTPLFL